MFEREIAQTIRTISTTVLRQQPYVRLSELLEDTRVPERVKAFFAMEVNWWLYNAALDRNSDTRFDYSSPELASLVSYMEQVQFRYAQFDRDEFGAVLDSAVKLMYNYLCRPQTTLKWFIFRGQPIKPLDEVMLRLGAFTDYMYFQTVFNNWVERKRKQRQGLEAISAAEFERVIRRIDDQILLSCTVEDLLELMEPLFATIVKEGEIPVSALIIFFDDKNIQRLVEQLEGWTSKHGESINRDQFIGLLETLLDAAEGEPEADFSEVYQQDALDEVVKVHLEKHGKLYLDYNEVREEDMLMDTESVTTDIPDPEPVIPPIQPHPTRNYSHTPTTHNQPVSPEELSAEAREAYKRSFSPTAFKNDPMEDHPYEEAMEPEAEPDGESEDIDEIPGVDLHPAVEEVGDDDDREEEDEEIEPSGSEEVLFDDDDEDEIIGHPSVQTTTLPRSGATVTLPRPESAVASPDIAVQSSARPDVREFIDDKLALKIIKKLFRRNRNEYEKALDRLNTATDWRSAERILSEVFSAKNIEPYSRTAIRLTDSVYARYMQRTVKNEE